MKRYLHGQFRQILSEIVGSRNVSSGPDEVLLVSFQVAWLSKSLFQPVSKTDGDQDAWYWEVGLQRESDIDSDPFQWGYEVDNGSKETYFSDKNFSS